MGAKGITGTAEYTRTQCAFCGSKQLERRSGMRRLDPPRRVSNLRHVLGPYRPEDLARYEEGLRKAGLPE
jgi:hypothetical protein